MIGRDAAREWLDVVAVAAARRPETCSAQHSGVLSRERLFLFADSVSQAEEGMLDAARRQSHLGRRQAGATVLAPVCGCFFPCAFPRVARFPYDGVGSGWTRTQSARRALFSTLR